MWTAIAAILSVLRIDHARDSNGKRIQINPELTTGIQVSLKPFPCSFSIVNTAREAQLQEMLKLK